MSSCISKQSRFNGSRDKQPGSPCKPRERDLPACQRTAQAIQHCYIPKDVMTERPRLWQAHLSKISNFLKPGPVWWKWREDGSVEFFDAPGEPNSREQWPQLYHFRSSNINRICQNLEETCEQCTFDPDQLPLYKIINNK